MTNKKLFITIFFILFIAIIILGSVFLSKDNKEVVELSEGDALKDNNYQIVDNVLVGEIDEVGGIDEVDHYQGNLDSKVKVIVYCDFSNIFCKDLNKNIEEIKNKFSENIVIAYRHFLVGGDNVSFVSAMASECAEEQNMFWEMYDELYVLNQNSELTKENIKKRAEIISLELDQFDECVENKRYEDKIIKQMNEAERYGVLGAPTIFVNKEVLPGAYPFEDFVDSTGRERKGLKSIIEKYL
jgi:predicted DsbA family dithiol-disulfide isomerase